MKHILLYLILGVVSSVSAEGKGVIGKALEQGKTVIYSFDNFLPEKSKMDIFPTLVVIKWEYDGSQDNGMPSGSIQEQIYKLEDVLIEMEANDAAFRAYSRTGNNLREFVYYTTDQSSFLEIFNQTVSGHPRYPIEIVFYQDPDWTDYQKLMADFKSDS